MKMKLRLVPVPTLKQEYAITSKAFEAMNFWDSNEKNFIEFEFNGEKHKIEFVLCSKKFLKSISDNDEKMGMYFLEGFFISKELFDQKPSWIPYILIKLYTEKFINPGLDTTGKAIHWESLLKSMGFAGIALEDNEYKELLDFLKNHESTGFFDIGGEKSIEGIIEKYSDFRQFKKEYKEYLHKHHNNGYVRNGREEETISRLLKTDKFATNTIKAQTIFDALISTSDNKELVLFKTAYLLDRLIVAGEGDLVISEDFAQIAYALTKDVNGKIDFIKFINTNSNSRDNTIRINKANKNYQATFAALRKRIGYEILKLQEQTQKQIGNINQKLDSITSEVQTLMQALDFINKNKTRNAEIQKILLANNIKDFHSIPKAVENKALEINNLTLSLLEKANNLGELGDICENYI